MARKNKCWSLPSRNTFNQDDCLYTKDGISPKIWGPAGWVFLHSIAANLPNRPNKPESSKEMQTYKKRIYAHWNFINSLKYVLPCGDCRNNVQKNLKSLNWNIENLSSRKAFIEFMYKLHSKVNRETNSSSKYTPPTLNEVIQMYNNFRRHKDRELLGQCGRLLLRVLPVDENTFCPKNTFTVHEKCIRKQKKY